MGGSKFYGVNIYGHQSLLGGGGVGGDPPQKKLEIWSAPGAIFRPILGLLRDSS